MKKRFLHLILPVITLVLEILPYGAVCNFARPATDGSIGRFRELYSYFDLVPFGYANFAPLITAVFSCIILMLIVCYCITGKQALAVVSEKLLWVCAAISLCPLLYGLHYFSLVGVLITLSLMGEALWLHYSSLSR